MKSFKQYLSESDPNSWKPMPGYTYDEQEPELRSDEDAEKTKEWYTSVAGDGAPSKMDNGDTLIRASEVDAEGRPVGRTKYQTVLSPENKAREEQNELDRITLKWDEERAQIIQKQDAPAIDIKSRILDQKMENKYNKKEEEKLERGKRIRKSGGIPMDDLA